jgi:hypothetical protein
MRYSFKLIEEVKIAIIEAKTEEERNLLRAKLQGIKEAIDAVQKDYREYLKKVEERF